MAEGLLRVVSNSALDAEEAARLERKKAEEKQAEPVLLNMQKYLKMCWEAAKLAKQPIEQSMLASKRQRDGQYDPDKLAKIREMGGSEIFIGLTEVKCRAAESWVRDILLDAGAPPWELEPTPIPELSPKQTQEMEQAFTTKLLEAIALVGQGPNLNQIPELRKMFEVEFRAKLYQEAQKRANRMADKIKDQFAEGGWYEGFNAFVSDLVTYPAGIMKGPVIRRKNVLGWDSSKGKTEVVVKEKLAPDQERVDPFRFYPEPGISDLNDGYVFEHHPTTRSGLAALIGVPGYDDAAIKMLLTDGSRNSWFFTSGEMEKNELEKKYNAVQSPTDMFDMLEFWGKVSGSMLREWGMSAEQVPDEHKEYDANIFLVGNVIIKAILNYDPLGQKPYAMTSFFKIPGALWGKGIPEVIADLQTICNAAARSLVNNMGIASGPQVEIDVDRLAGNEDITGMHPWKIWQVRKDANGGSSQALHFDQPDDRSGPLMAVYEKFSKLADEHSGIPAYVSGDISVTGAGRTSSGLSMLMGAAGKGIRQVVSHVDNDVIKVVVQRQFVYNMRYDPDESIKGDVIVVPRGAVNLAVKETTDARRSEFLQATANPFDMEIMGIEGRAAVLREVSKRLQMPHEEIVPSKEKMEIKAKASAGQQIEQQPSSGQTPTKPTPLDPAGNPMGGQAGNLVSNKISGQA